MLQVIRPSATKTEYAYRRIFRSDCECHGFLCEEDGSPIFRDPHERIVFDMCVAKERFTDCGRVRREYTRTYPAIARCECGREVRLEKRWGQPAIRCGCGRHYAPDGKEIAVETTDSNKEREAF